MFEIYKRVIGGEVAARYKNTDVWIAYEGHRNQALKSRLFIAPQIPFIDKPESGNDRLFMPFEYMWIEPFEMMDGVTMAVCITKGTVKELLAQVNSMQIDGYGDIEERNAFKSAFFDNHSEDEIILLMQCYILASKMIGGNGEIADIGIFVYLSKDGNYLGFCNDNKGLNRKSEYILYEQAMINKILSFLRFINLGNITTQSIDIDRKMRKYCQKQKSNQIKYYILAVNKPSLSKKTNSNPDLLPDHKTCLPLHQVRGHLADYTQGKGLFGKYNVRVWIDNHLRGDIQYGQIKKDYEIRKAV